MHAKGRCQQTLKPPWSTRRGQSACQEQRGGMDIAWVRSNKPALAIKLNQIAHQYFWWLAHITELQTFLSKYISTEIIDIRMCAQFSKHMCICRNTCELHVFHYIPVVDTNSHTGCLVIWCITFCRTEGGWDLPFIEGILPKGPLSAMRKHGG